jgi:peroxiredoxin
MNRNTNKLAVALLAFLFSGPARADNATVGQPAPDFKATTLDGKSLSLADFKGQVLVINFWATWCAPCKAELPLLEAYYHARGAYGLRVIAIATEYSLPPEKLKPIAEHLTLSMIRHFDGNYRVLGGMPTNYVIDRAGIVRYAKADAFNLDSLNALLVPLLNEPATAPSRP